MVASTTPCEYKPVKSCSSDGKLATSKRWYQNAHWENIFWVVIFPFLGLLAVPFTPLHSKTAWFATIYYFIGGMGITAGYHRLWAHRSYTASVPLRIYLALIGGGAMEDSILKWVRDHRAHHRYTDTGKDPYSVQTGLFHAHIGWLMTLPDPEIQGQVDMSDLMNDPVVVWQQDWYSPIAMFMAYILPCLIGGLWGDWWGCFIYGGVVRAFLVQQSTFCVNSLAHWLGEHPYDDRDTPRDHFVTALFTLGEGYHNFHHEFPSDYRNAILWYQYDPTKWMIWLWKQVGLAHNLKMFRQNEIDIGRLQQQQKKLDQRVAGLQSTKIEHLPVMSWDEYQDGVLNGHSWLAIAGVIYDVNQFAKEHPGGKALIESAIGKDATAMFNGGIYNHSKAAHRFLSELHIAILRGGGEVEILKLKSGT